MVMDCCYCGKRASNCGEGRTFHQFPLSQPELLQLWLININLGSNFKPIKSMRLCSDHFQKECFRRTKAQTKLLPGSIPTIFGSYKFMCIYCLAVKTNKDQRSFHKFPLENPKLLQRWLVSIGKQNFNPSKASHLCSDHFENNCFRPSGYGDSRSLRNSAVPTIFLNIMPEEITLVTEKMVHDPSEQGRPAKHARVDTQSALAPHKTVNFISPNSWTSVPAMEQKITISGSPCTGIQCESQITSNSPNQVGSTAVSKEIPYPVLPSTPEQDRQSTTTEIAKRIRIINHDHYYETTPRTLRKKLVLSRSRIKNLQQEAKVHKQKITRLQRRISSLKDIISELRKT